MYLRHNSSLMEQWSYIYYKSSFAIRSQDLQDPKTFIWTEIGLIYVTVTQIGKHCLRMHTHKLKK